MSMDPPIINESSFSTVNPSLTEIWPVSSTDGGGVEGLRLGGFGENNDYRDNESTVTGPNGGGKRRRDVNLETDSSKFVSTSCGNDLSNSNDKRLKRPGSIYETGDPKVDREGSSSEPSKGYIHVRARRGQATDSHSLAERARREKISERMKILQDLVPGCNTVIGKAVVLDEIINYIQSLQHQIEFLSMKLEAESTRMGSLSTKNLEPPPFIAAGLYGHGPQPEWLHMQLASGFETTKSQHKARF